jgi:DNA-binding MarR family transcriptional regulator
MSEGGHADELSELPPSAKLVYKVLEENEPRTQKEICNESWLAARTARDAINYLESQDLITSYPNPDDARQRLYKRTS